MATRSNIAIKNSDGTVESVYCHNDGYLENNGKILSEHWTDEAKLRALLSEGQLSSLGEVLGEPHGFGFGDRPDGVCTFYRRDRGESNVDSQKFQSSAEWLRAAQQEYNYLFDAAAGRWSVFFYGDDQARDLAAALRDEVEDDS